MSVSSEVMPSGGRVTMGGNEGPEGGSRGRVVRGVVRGVMRGELEGVVIG